MSKVIDLQVWTFKDKASWPERGEWDGEPDKAQWTDAETGLTCLAVRAHSNWCGYVGVPEGHPCFKQGYDDIPYDDVECHGGLTFAGACQEGNREHGVCHIPAPGEPDHMWWLGFDCAHAGDYRPAEVLSVYEIMQRYPHAVGYETYRNLAYVQNECRKLAASLKRMDGAKS